MPNPIHNNESEPEKFKLSIPMILLIGLGSIVGMFFVSITIRRIYFDWELTSYIEGLKADGQPTTRAEFDSYQEERLADAGLDIEECRAPILLELLDTLETQHDDDYSDFDDLESKIISGKSITHDPKLKSLYDKYKTLTQDITNEIQKRQDIFLSANNGAHYGESGHSWYIMTICTYARIMKIFIHNQAALNLEQRVNTYFAIAKASYLLRNQATNTRWRWIGDGIGGNALLVLLAQTSIPENTLKKIKATIDQQILTYSSAYKKDLVLNRIRNIEWCQSIVRDEIERWSNKPLHYIRTFGWTVPQSYVQRSRLLEDKLCLNMPEDSLVGYDYSTAEEYFDINCYFGCHMSSTTDDIHSYFRFRARLKAASSAIDVMLFKAKFNHLPETAKELESKMNVTLPNDPFVAAKLIYKKLDNGFVIYSVGANKMDDGGEYDYDTPKDDAAFKVEFTTPRKESITKD